MLAESKQGKEKTLCVPKGLTKYQIEWKGRELKRVGLALCKNQSG